MSLHKRTLELLELDRGSWPETARKLNLDYAWMQKFAQKKINDPGVNKVERLYRYLAEKHGVAHQNP